MWLVLAVMLYHIKVAAEDAPSSQVACNKTRDFSTQPACVPLWQTQQQLFLPHQMHGTQIMQQPRVVCNISAPQTTQ